MNDKVKSYFRKMKNQEAEDRCYDKLSNDLNKISWMKLSLSDGFLLAAIVYLINYILGGFKL